MKRVGYLYEKIYSLDNIKLAVKNSQKGKRKQRQVIEFNKNKEQNILKIHLILLSKTYKISNYKTKFIKDKKKIRELKILPYFPCRIIQHCILQVISPIFNRCFPKNTYSAIKYRGIHKCLKDTSLLVKSFCYCLKLDIKKYYENIDNSILKQTLSRKFKDVDLLNLLFQIIDKTKGCVIGSYLSQYFGNFYLTQFEYWLIYIKKVKFSVYMDDICIFHNDKQFLYELKYEIINYLKNNLKLELSRYQVFPVNKGVDFVGYEIYPTHIKLRKSIKLNMIKNLNENNKPSYYGWLSHCNSINLQNKYFNND